MNEEKHHTFRKRRLSFSNIRQTQQQKSRRLSIDERSLGSDSAGAARTATPNKTVHASELLQQASVSSFLQKQTLLPPLSTPPPIKKKWGRQRTIEKLPSNEQLPFALDVVGTWSCHGVEPVYEEWSENATTDEEEVDPPALMAAKINQDRGGIICPYGNHPQTALFAVYDGHGFGGELVSQFCLHEIPRRLEQHAEFTTNLPQALHETFVEVDRALQKETIIEHRYSGTTACVALLRTHQLTLAHVGDSRAVLARRMSPTTLAALALTHDHNPDAPTEHARIVGAGGFVSLPPGPGLSARVWLDEAHTQIGLAMSRSLGDHAVSEVGVIAEPEVSNHKVTKDDEFLVLASDGVWEFLSSDDVVQLVAKHLDKGATAACQVLIETAAEKWHEEEGEYRDDITAIVVRLQELWK